MKKWEKELDTIKRMKLVKSHARTTESTANKWHAPQNNMDDAVIAQVEDMELIIPSDQEPEKRLQLLIRQRIEVVGIDDFYGIRCSDS
ncbi:MAG: hypothetical protein LUQ47_03195 [Methanotrichaceae archaeon]|nr:hypothetical protein [Methanotrichaceae archaeon]